jgi:hypothetical protein
MGFTCFEGFGSSLDDDCDAGVVDDVGLEQPTTPNAARDCTRRRRDSDTEVRCMKSPCVPRGSLPGAKMKDAAPLEPSVVDAGAVDDVAVEGDDV